MSISVHCFYSIPCVKSKMEPSQNCTGSGAVIGPMPAFRRCLKLRPFGFSAALKHFRLRPGLTTSIVPPTHIPLAAAARIYGGIHVCRMPSGSVGWRRTGCAVIGTQLLTWQDSGSGLVVLRSTPGAHQSVRRQHSKDSGHVF